MLAWAADKRGTKVTDQAVSVDRDFARFGNKSYAINKINSVEVRHRRPYGQGGMFVWGLLCFILALLSLQSFSDATGASMVTLLLAMLCGYLAHRAWKKSKIVEHQLFLMVSSSEAQAIASQDGSMIAALRDRIERAMAGQLA